MKRANRNQTHYFVDGKPLRQIAEAAGLNVRTVTGRYIRGVRDLAELTRPPQSKYTRRGSW